MITGEQLLHNLRQASVDTPFTVEPTRDGFIATHDFLDVRWANLLGAGRAERAFEADVKLDEAKGKWLLTEKYRAMSWSSGPDGTLMPRFSAHASMKQGITLLDMQMGSMAAPSVSGGPVVAQWSGSATELKRWVREQMELNGWPKGARRLGWQAIVGLVAVGLAVLAMLSPLVLRLFLQ